MFRPFLIFLLLITCAPANSQVPDFIALKKKNGRTVRNYYAGGWPITFMSKTGAIYEGPIEKIDNDSVHVRFFHVIGRPTIWNTTMYDTISTYTVPFHYKEIDHIIIPQARKRKRYLFNLGKIMQLGGFGYDVLNIVNSIYLKDKFTSEKNLKNVAIATGVGLAGTFIKSRFGNAYRKPASYKIVYVDMD